MNKTKRGRRGQALRYAGAASLAVIAYRALRASPPAPLPPNMTGIPDNLSGLGFSLGKALKKVVSKPVKLVQNAATVKPSLTTALKVTPFTALPYAATQGAIGKKKTDSVVKTAKPYALIGATAVTTVATGGLTTPALIAAGTAAAGTAASQIAAKRAKGAGVPIAQPEPTVVYAVDPTTAAPALPPAAEDPAPTRKLLPYLLGGAAVLGVAGFFLARGRGRGRNRR